MCYVYVINFCKGNINNYINFESISSVTYFNILPILIFEDSRRANLREKRHRRKIQGASAAI